MSLTSEQIQRIATLARLQLDETQAEATRSKLNGIFALIEEMQSVDTSGVAPMSHPQDVAQRLRTDAVTEPDRRDAFQRIAPSTEAGLYLVPKVIE